MLAGLISDDKNFTNIKLAKKNPSNFEKEKLINMRTQLEKLGYIKASEPIEKGNAKVLKKINNTNQGFADALLLSLITLIAGSVITTIMYFIIK